MPGSVYKVIELVGTSAESWEDAARVALRRFSIALAEIEFARGEALLAQKSGRARLRVGTLTVAMLDIIPAALSRLFAEQRNVDVEVTEGTAIGLTESLFRGELDCIVGQMATNETTAQLEVQVEQVKLFDEPRCLICNAGHPLAAQRSASLAVLAAHDWVLPPVPSAARQSFDGLFISRGMAPPIPVVESQAVHSNVDIVATTDLLGVAPLVLARRHIATGRLRRVSPSVTLGGIPISLFWRSSSTSDPFLMRFRQAIIEANDAGSEQFR